MADPDERRSMRLMVEKPRALLLAMGAVVSAVLLFLLAMDDGVRQNAADLFGYGGVHSDADEGSRDLFHTEVSIRGRRGGETYAAFDARRDASPGVEGFHGFGCLESCASHEAGYLWAASQKLANASDCRGASWAFVEGCAAYSWSARNGR